MDSKRLNYILVYDNCKLYKLCKQCLRILKQTLEKRLTCCCDLVIMALRMCYIVKLETTKTLRSDARVRLDGIFI